MHTMTSPSPTQASPTQAPAPISEYKPVLTPEQKPESTPEDKPVRATPLRKRIGETRTARIIKAILRPPIKVLYYLSTWIKKHKLPTLGIILLLLASVGTTTFLQTGEVTFSSIQRDPFNFSYYGGKGEGESVEKWLYALREGDSTILQLLAKDMTQPPDPGPYIDQFSESKAHLTWDTIKVITVNPEPDMTVDSFVQVQISAKGPGNTPTQGLLIWHFVTASINGRDLLLGVDLVSARPLQS
jgi:hypothetical protein